MPRCGSPFLNIGDRSGDDLVVDEDSQWLIQVRLRERPQCRAASFVELQLDPENAATIGFGHDSALFSGGIG